MLLKILNKHTPIKKEYERTNQSRFKTIDFHKKNNKKVKILKKKKKKNSFKVTFLKEQSFKGTFLKVSKVKSYWAFWGSVVLGAKIDRLVLYRQHFLSRKGQFYHKSSFVLK